MPEYLSEKGSVTACRACGAVCGTFSDDGPDFVCYDCWRLFKIHRQHPPGDLDDDFNAWLARRLFLNVQRLERRGISGRCEALTRSHAGGIVRRTGGHQCALGATSMRGDRRVCGLHAKAEIVEFAGDEPYDPYQTLSYMVGRLVKTDERLLKAISSAIGIENPYRRMVLPKGQKGAAPLDLTGRRFGMLVALQITPRVARGRHRYWLCQCDCGTQKEVAGHALSNGMCVSCGCLRRGEIPSARATAQAAQQPREAGSSQFAKRNLSFDMS